MESFMRRLKYYGIGFGIGMLFVVFFFNNRGCSWIPSNRVKNSILSRIIVVSDQTEADLKKKGISHKELIEVLNDGDIDFGASDKNKNNKAYLIEKNGVKYVFTLPYESFVSEVFVTSNAKKVKHSTEGIGTFIHFPNDKNLVYTDTTARLKCQQEALGLISDTKIWKLIKKSGKLDFSKTIFNKDAKAEQYIEFKWKGKTIGATVVWYKDKLNIKSFHHESLLECD